MRPEDVAVVIDSAMLFGKLGGLGGIEEFLETKYIGVEI
jgi:hypothetical protein